LPALVMADHTTIHATINVEVERATFGRAKR